MEGHTAEQLGQSLLDFLTSKSFYEMKDKLINHSSSDSAKTNTEITIHYKINVTDIIYIT